MGNILNILPSTDGSNNSKAMERVNVVLADANGDDINESNPLPIVGVPEVYQDKKIITVLDDFQTEDWSEGSSNTGVLTYDTSDFSSGAKSLKFVTNGDGTATQDQIYKNVDFSLAANRHNYIEFDYKVDDPTHITRLYLYLFTDASENDYYSCNFESTGRKWTSAESWETARVPLSSFIPNTVDATGNSIDRVRVIISDDGTPVTLRMNSFRLVSEPIKTYAAFTFDDSNKSTYTIAAPILEKYGFKGNNFNIEQNIGYSAVYMSEADIVDLEHRGWCNALHGQSPNTDGWANLTEPELNRYIMDSINYFSELGISSGLDIVSYPNGNYGNDKENYIYQIVKKYCRLARLTSTSHTNAQTPSDPLRLTVGEFYLRASNPVADITASLDKLSTHGGIAIFTGHDIVASGASDTDYTTADFTTVVEKVAELSESGLIEVVTLAELRDILTGMNAITTSAMGGRIVKTDRLTANTTLDINDYKVFCNGTFTVTLPAGMQGTEYKIVNSGAGTITVSPDGTEDLLGANSDQTLSAGESLTIAYDTTDGWF